MRRQRGWVVSSSDSQSKDSSSHYRLGVFLVHPEFKSSARLENTKLVASCQLLLGYICVVCLKLFDGRYEFFFHVAIFRITPQLCKPHTTHNPLIRSDKGLELKTSFFDPFPELNLLFPTQIKKANFKVFQWNWVLECCKSIMYSAAKAIDN